LEVAQKNCELEIQIKTIDDVLQSIPLSSSSETISTNRSEESVEIKYENLLQDHKKLARRVHEIEEILYESTKTRGSFGKSNRNSRHGSSTQNLMTSTQRKSAAIGKRSTGFDGF
jgi:hypothetical protein